MANEDCVACEMGTQSSVLSPTGKNNKKNHFLAGEGESKVEGGDRKGAII